MSSAAPTRLVLVRHGQTDYNRDGRLQGQVDIPLNETGRTQARAVARAVAQNPPDLILASPLGRALETARTIGEACGLPVSTDQALVERGFGQWEGLHSDAIRARWPQQLADHREHRRVDGLGIESREGVAERFAASCLRHVGENPGQTVLIVAHGAAITLGITELLGLHTSEFRGLAGLENCHRSVLEPLSADPEGRRMRLLSHNLSPDFT
ncbi:histidine phosphatase family protein [Brachybacterium sp. J144]|uniref:histidine phosphatase family protein n=1 Tax=Brachybacterium sp. J144 TaxID=3116487 RepID=UPI002E79F7BF|nr:histidine phosphatase family protein [Brachybacterium sp. J144]MEE1649834.1 histidine phosphatase family protein [Brachybacterium sp. J144]